MTEITLLLGLSGSRFFIFLLAITVTATHEQSPFPLVEGVLPLEIIPSGLRPGGHHPLGGWHSFLDNSYLSVIITPNEKTRGWPIFSPRRKFFSGETGCREKLAAPPAPPKPCSVRSEEY
jgi:hypothetical protein